MGDLPALIQAGSNGTQVGLMMATDICNNGNVQVNWFQLPETDHPVIPQNLYRMSGGANNNERFEQIGQSWVKHAFVPLQQNACGFGCTPSPDSAHLGVGCSTADSANFNASQSSLGSRAWVNPFTGIFPSTSNNHAGHAHGGTEHRIFVEANDLNTAMNPGATYYGEAQLVTPQEYAWCAAHQGECNMYNNASYRQFAVAGTTTFNFSAVGDTVRMTPAIFAWPGATILTIEPAQGVDGKAFLAYKVTQTGPFLWHYEFAIYNQNLDRGISYFSVPGGCGIGSAFNLGFHAPLNPPGTAHDGTAGDAGYSNVPWSATLGVSWSTESFAQNPNANAIRWGTLYNFRFDGGPPWTVNGTIGFFKTNDGMTVQVPGPVPECAPSPPPPPPPTPTPTPTPTSTPSPKPTATPFPSPFTFPDLVLTMTDSPDPVQVGHNLTYTITVSNVDPSSSMTATMTDHLPAGVNFVSAAPSQGSCTGTSTVVCDLGFIAAGASATVSLVVTPTTTGTLSNTASVPDFEDPTPLNNTDTELTTVGPAASPSPMPCDKMVTENFDAVTAPALPAGWSSAFWVTSTTDPDTAPNDAFVNAPAFVSDRPLDSPFLVVNSAAAVVAFRNNYNLDSGGGVFFDGGVLEVSSPNINAGAFTDITDPAVGGSFIVGGYDGMISSDFGNPLGGHMAWSGNSGGYINSVLNLGPNVNGQTIQLRFRLGSDSGGGSTGVWRIDSMSFQGVCTTFPPPSTPTPTPTPSATPIPTPSATPSPVPTPILPPGGNGKIAFRSVRDGSDSDIYVMDPDGSNVTNLTHNLFLFLPDGDPDWSPDGTKIVFTVNNDEFSQDNIVVMNANGTNAVTLTNLSKDFAPVWSPDGQKIAFASVRDGNLEIYVMNADGSNPINLTNNPAADGSYRTGPCWSPDGGKIAFASDRGGSGFEIYVMNANGSNPVPLTSMAGDDTDPDWSPDGTKIAFTHYLAPNEDIYVMNADGSNPIPLTNGPLPGRNFEPAWSPDGTKMVFTSNRAPGGNNYDVYVMNADGSNPTNLTNDPRPDSRPDWQRIAISPTPTPTPPSHAVNLSTRMRVETGDRVGIGGFIITGAPKYVLIRAIGPSLFNSVPNPLADPVLELHGPGTFPTITNNNWRDTQEQEIQNTSLPPDNNLESAIAIHLDPGTYTAIVRGNGDTSGVALVEVYDLEFGANSRLANLSTRAFVGTGNNVVIAGFILGGGNPPLLGDRIVVRGIGPSLPAGGLSNVLADPTLELHNSNGAILIANDNWQDDPAQAAEINAAGLAPTNDLEAAMAGNVPPDLYTAILAGVNHSTGIGLIEIYDRGATP